MKKTAKILALVMSLIMVFALAACGSTQAVQPAPKEEPAPTATEAPAVEKPEVEPVEEPVEEQEEVTVESLIKGFDEKMKNAEGTKFNMKLDMEMNLNLLGEAENMSMLADMNIESDMKNAHALVKSTATSSEGTRETDSEVYVIEEDGKIFTYTKGEDGWKKSEGTEMVDSEALSKFVFDDYSAMKLEESGNEYVITGTVPLKDAMTTLPEDMASSFGESVGIDLSDASFADAGGVNVEYRFDKETKDMISVKIDMADAVSGVMNALVAQMMGGLMTGGEPTVISADGVTVTASEVEEAAQAEEAPAEEAPAEKAPDEEAPAEGEVAADEEISEEDMLAMVSSMFKVEFPKFVVSAETVEIGAVEIVLPEEAANAQVAEKVEDEGYVVAEEVTAEEAEAVEEAPAA